MSELSTADLAGGTSSRDRLARESDATASTLEPRHDLREDGFRSTDTDFRDTDGRDTEFDTRDEAITPPMSSTTPAASTASLASTPRRTPLANPAATDGATSDTGAEPLFPSSEAEGFRGRWVEVQTGFVDEPRNAVEQADSLVAEMMQRLAGVFADERGKLEEQWSRGDDIGTEDLRQALRRYRSFFDRLLSV
jgi:hypothetical protein